MLGKNNYQQEYEQHRYAGRAIRQRALLEQALFVCFIAGVLLLSIYLLLGDNQRSALKRAAGFGQASETGESEAVARRDANETGAPGRQAAAEPRAPAGEQSGTTAAAGADADERDSSAYRFSRDWPAPQAAPEPATNQVKVAPPPEPEQHDQPAPAPAPKTPAVAAQSPAPAAPAPERAPDTSLQSQPEQAAQARTENASVQIGRARFVYQLIENRPTDEVTYIDYAQLNEGYLLFYSEVSGSAGSELVHEWRYNGEVVANQKFTLTGEVQQLVSRVYIPESAYGTWRVYVRNQQGEALKIGSALYPRH